MTKQEITETLKNSYNRDIRKQLVKTILKEEKENALPNYKLINQIFSYVLSELGWDMAKSTKEWDSTPLDIMEESFPKIKTTLWYKEQIVTAKQAIDVEFRS